jgi:hypothetical protein
MNLHPNIFKILEDKGAEVIKFDYYPDRGKVSGRMWGGSAELKLDDTIYYLKLWWHGPEDDPGKEKIKEQLSINGIEYNGKYYDIYWHTWISDEGIFLQPEGWFYNRELREKIEKELPYRTNYNFEYNKQTPCDALCKLGFIEILSFT